MVNNYEKLKVLAQETRERHNLTTASFSLSSMRRVYKQEGIVLYYCPHKLRKIRGAYLIIEGEPHVFLNKAMKPKEPRIFTLAHELKHHLVDQELAQTGPLGCQDVSWTRGSRIEIGAEIFASELIYPEAEFLSLVEDIRIAEGAWRSEDVVRLKKICPAPVSYTFLVKRLKWFGIVDSAAFRGVRFQNLEDSMFGVPYYQGKKRI